ncbi:hypothetical protein K402DRAFT_331986 [Aulographum hederae CBS 113979]|uniref:Glyoxalase-like domain-containing protein n=1 Tax=Aulographum hederae CBS 113979 TaxID=1176131 RepID=A0A6G1H1B5_9PEZI|nr:hypothetical protein K402DRAFT_331986 [Aulographum hederae CBS 113979]
MSDSKIEPGLPLAPNVAPTRLRQIALVAKDLKKAEQQLTHVIGTEVIYVDPGVEQWGLKNILVAIGGDVVEVVSPFKDGTTAGRLLSKRGDGGYMIIMQTVDATKQRNYIESKGLSKVIWSHESNQSVAYQYHPRGIQGGMMPELDSHFPSKENPTPITSRFSPWHACRNDYASYSAGMKRTSDLSLVGAVCRLAPGDIDTDAAAAQWEHTFGIAKSRDGLAFTNARLDFIRGIPGSPEGLVSVTIAVKGKDRFDAILERASKEGLCGDGWINMVGIRWYFVLEDDNAGSQSRL